MSRKKPRRSKSRAKQNRDKSRVRPSLYLILLPLALVLVGGGIWLLGQGQKAGPVTPGETEAEIIPHEGEQTSYGLALSLDNTKRFIDYYHSASLTSQQRATMRDALLPLRAPCCDDNSMATCCCPCNLAKSVWGLSGYLIADQGYNAGQVREAALQWLRFIHSDYYVMRELENRGVDPGIYGLSYESPCYNGRYELPFVDGGCGGMEALRL